VPAVRRITGIRIQYLFIVQVHEAVLLPGNRTVPPFSMMCALPATMEGRRSGLMDASPTEFDVAA
jgi:hypothetical protein